MEVRPTTDDGLVDPAWWRGRQDDYLEAATSVRHPGSVLNLLDHLERARRDGPPADLSDVTPAVVDGWCRRIDGWLDCADFDVLRMLLLWYADRDALPAHVVDALRTRFVGFRYWYTDPGPEGIVDARWYWSENHRLIFHTVELLAGQALPGEVFTTAGLTGVGHQERAAESLAAWFDEKAADGFSEWHSDAYYEKDLVPLLALAEWADDPALAERAAAFADLVLADLAVHSHRDNVGSTHGRSYMRFKATAPTQTTFSALKLCFDRTDAPWPLDDGGDDGELLPATEGAAFLARCHRYRPPAIVRRIATSAEELLDREGMGTELDPAEPPGPTWEVPVRADGLSYTDPAMVPFWWDRGALTPWQLVPLTLDALDRHRLWDGHLFAHIRSVRDALGDDRPTLQALAHGLHRMVNAGLLTRVDTCTWRNGHGMLSTAQSYRPGCTGYQHHVWQATLDEHAVVFTTHPAHGPTARAGDYLDGDRYWTGSATLPRAVQQGRAVVVQYAPGFAPPDLDVLAGFGYADETHAYLPTERFDEVVLDGPWTLARRRDGYVALWTWRPAAWRAHDPAATFTNGLVGPFDLVAEGGPDNVWICEVGDADRWGSFAAFAAAVTTAPVEVEDHGWGDDGAHRGFAVTYASPAEGRIDVSWGGPLHVDGREVAITGYPRMQNRYVTVPAGGTTFALADDDGSWTLDLMAGTRRPG